MGDQRTASVTAWAPGRINLIGEHTDYSGGLVLPAAIQYGIALDVLSTAGQISLTSSQFGAAESFATNGSGPTAHGWARYAQAVAVELELLGRPSVGLIASLSSDLPAGAGLSSSAALEVAVALALCVVADFELDPLQLALACQRAELRAVGVPCGILDQAACVLGQDGHAILLDCASLEHHPVRVPESAGLVIIDSGVERSLEHTAYAERREQQERALQLVGAKRSTEVDAGAMTDLDDLSARRLRHVVGENVRVKEFADAFERDDLVTAGELLDASHASLRDDYEVSIPEVDLLVRLAKAAGAYGARLLGGGFGGSVLLLADADRANEIAHAAGFEYRRKTGKGGRTLAVRASAGAAYR